MDRLDELIIRHSDGTELKVWEAVLMYAAAQPSGVDGVAQVPSYYDGLAGRITEVWTFPLIGWVVLVLGAATGGIVYLVIRRRRRRAAGV
jgi:hypothetical protein